MVDSLDKACRVCGDSIPSAAIKCRHCGSYQNWRRFLDLGQGTIALLIALISVSTLAVESGRRAFKSIFDNPLAPSISGKVLALSLDEVELLFNNNGESRVLLIESALCRLPLVRDEVNLITATGELVRYPRREEVESIFSVFYSSDGNGQFLDPNTGFRLTAKRTGVLKEDGLPINEGVGEVKGYCSVNWIGQDAGDDGAFWAVSAIDIHRASLSLAKLPDSALINGKVVEREDASPVILPSEP